MGGVHYGILSTLSATIESIPTNTGTEKCGICELFELNGKNGRDLIDGLHPNVNGAKKIAEYNFREVFNYFHVYD